MPIPLPPLPRPTAPLAPAISLVRALFGPIARRAREVWRGPPDEIKSKEVEREIEAVPPYVRRLLRERGIPIRESELPSAFGEYDSELGAERILLDPRRLRENYERARKLQEQGGDPFGYTKIRLALGLPLEKTSRDKPYRHEIPGWMIRSSRPAIGAHEAAHSTLDLIGRPAWTFPVGRLARVVAPRRIVNVADTVVQWLVGRRDIIWRDLFNEHCADRSVARERYACHNVEEFVAEVLAAYWLAQWEGKLAEMEREVPKLYEAAKQLDHRLLLMAG